MRQVKRAAPWAAVWLLCAAAPGAAQPFEQAGVRAQGMAGAFVAVADDASAVWWNPAGLAGGAFFNFLFEHQQQSSPDDTVNALSVGTPPLGASYQRLRYAVPPAGQTRTSRETVGGTETSGALVTHEAGMTLLQSLTADFVVGATVKFVRGVIGDRGTNQADVDVGMHYRAGPLRAGLVVRNVAEPSFRISEDTTLTLERQARAGVAWAADSLTVAADLDLTSAPGLTGGRRLAIGAERRWQQRWALRGGMRLRTTEGANPWASLGASYAVKSGMWIDGFWGDGEDAGARWGLSGRVTY